MVGELVVEGDHGHVDAGVDGHTDGLAHVGGDAVDGVEFLDVGPVADEDAVEGHLVAEEAGEDGVAGMDGDAVDLAGVNHQ